MATEARRSIWAWGMESDEPTEEELTSDIPDFLANNDYSMEVKQKVLYSNARRILGLRDPEQPPVRHDQKEAVPA